MDPELIKHYAYELHWHLPEETQREAMEWLIANTPRDQLGLIFPPYGKSCWQNAVKVVERIGYPDNVAAFPSMVALFQDLNWPGAEETVLYFQTVEKSIVVSLIEGAANKAIAERDEDWLFFLYVVCKRLSISGADFEEAEIFEKMRQVYESN